MTNYYFISLTVNSQIYTINDDFSNKTETNLLAFYNINITPLTSQCFFALKIKYPLLLSTVSTSLKSSCSFVNADGAPCFF